MTLNPKISQPSLLLSTSPSNSPSNQYLNHPPSPSKLPSLHPSLNRSFNNESLIKNQKSLQLSNKHSILRSFMKVDKEEASLRDESSLNRSFKRMSAAMKLIGPNPTSPSSLESSIVSSLLPINDTKIRSKCRSVDLAQQKWLEESSHSWRAKLNSTPKSRSKTFQAFLLELFEALDEDHSNKLTADEFIMPLLAYGISSDPKYIEKALIQMFSKDLSEIFIEKEQFLRLFVEDPRTENILKALEFHTRCYLNDVEKARVARRKSLGILTRTETRIEEVVPKVFCTIDQYLLIIKKWWKELTLCKKSLQDDNEKIHKSKFMDFLTGKNLVSNKIEAFRLATTSERMGMIDFESFEKIFLKAILKSALINLAEGLNNKKFAGEDSLAIRLARCQRKFMVSGVGQKNTVLSLQGRQALQAVSRFQTYHIQSARNKAMVDVREVLRKDEEDADDKLLGYLYKINEDAEKFLDPWGNLKHGQKTWEIREKVRNSFEKF